MQLAKWRKPGHYVRSVQLCFRSLISICVEGSVENDFLAFYGTVDMFSNGLLRAMTLNSGSCATFEFSYFWCDSTGNQLLTCGGVFASLCRLHYLRGVSASAMYMSTPSFIHLSTVAPVHDWGIVIILNGDVRDNCCICMLLHTSAA